MAKQAALAGPTQSRWLSLLSLVCFANYLLRSSLGACAVVMANEYDWDTPAKASLLSAFFWGYFGSNVLCSNLASRYGGKMVLGAGAVCWSAFYIAVPLAGEFGFRPLWICLLAFGISEAPILAASSQIIASSTTLSERGRVIAVRGVALRVGQMVSTLATPILCKVAGWRSVFHLYGLTSALASLLWLSMAVIEPLAENNALQDAEDSEIDDELPAGQRTLKGTSDHRGHCSDILSLVPHRELRHAGVWSLLATQCAANAAQYTLMSWGPTYFAEELKVPLEHVGPALTLPVSTVALGAYASGHYQDRLVRRGMPIAMVRKRVMVSSLAFASTLLAPLGYVRSAGLACITLAMVFAALGTADSAMMANYIDIAPHSTAQLVGFGNALATLPGALGPAIIAAILDTTDSWASVFGLIGMLLVAAAVAFALHGVAEDVCRRQMAK